MSLDRHGHAKAGENACQVLHGGGIQTGEYQDRAGNARPLERGSRRRDFVGDAAHGDQYQIGALTDPLDTAQAKPALESRNRFLVVLADAVIHGSRQVPRLPKDRGGLLVVSRGEHRHARLDPHHAHVFQAMVRRSGVAILEAPSHPDDAHGQVVQ